MTEEDTFNRLKRMSLIELKRRIIDLAITEHSFDKYLVKRDNLMSRAGWTENDYYEANRTAPLYNHD